MTRCIRPRAGAAWPLAAADDPYMRANLARKRTGLAQADAVIAVSTTIAADLAARAPELDAHAARDHPEPGGHRRTARTRRRDGAADRRRPMRSTSASWRPTRARRSWSRSCERADLDWPLVIAGDGPDARR